MKEETEKSSTKVEISEMRKIFKERLGTHTIDHIMLMGQDSTFHQLKDFYEIKRVIGSGAFGVVVEAFNKLTTEESALKVDHCLMEFR